VNIREDFNVGDYLLRFYRVVQKDVSIFYKVAFFMERNTSQLFSQTCLADMYILCGVSFSSYTTILWAQLNGL